jgi:mRNA interferase MazF
VKRGDVVLAVLPGEHGKPRPAIVLQSDLLNEKEPTSFIVCPLTTMLRFQPEVRVVIEPSAQNGLRERSEAMVDKLISASRQRLRDVIGHIDATVMRAIDRSLVVVLGLS